MGDEHRVVVVEIVARPVAHGSARHMGHRIVPGELEHMFVAGQTPLAVSVKDL
jgi:hypothetical protein